MILKHFSRQFDSNIRFVYNVEPLSPHEKGPTGGKAEVANENDRAFAASQRLLKTEYPNLDAAELKKVEEIHRVLYEMSLSHGHQVRLDDVENNKLKDPDNTDDRTEILLGLKNIQLFLNDLNFQEKKVLDSDFVIGWNAFLSISTLPNGSIFIDIGSFIKGSKQSESVVLDLLDLKNKYEVRQFTDGISKRTGLKVEWNQETLQGVVRWNLRDSAQKIEERASKTMQVDLTNLERALNLMTPAEKASINDSGKVIYINHRSRDYNDEIPANAVNAMIFREGKDSLLSIELLDSLKLKDMLLADLKASQEK